MLTIHEFHETNRRRRNSWRNASSEQAASKLGDTLFAIAFASNELGGEVGELQNHVKKYLRGQMGLRGWHESTNKEQRKAIADEIADVIICVSLLAMEFNFNLESLLIEKFNETSEKHRLPYVLSSKPTTMLGEIALDTTILAEKCRAQLAASRGEAERIKVASEYVGGFLSLASRIEEATESEDDKSFEDAHVASFVWNGEFTIQLSNGRQFVANVPGVAPRSTERYTYTLTEKGRV